jgi:hypothetical protein
MLAVAAGVTIWLQRETSRQLQLELTQLREQRTEREALAEANRKLRGQQVSSEELARLRADRDAVARLRRELSDMEASVKDAPPPAPAAATPPTPPPAPKPIPSTAWKNAGRATPEAALETALWAAVGGDIDLLASTLELSPGARQRAEALLANLPPATRAQYATPEKFAALFTARDVPLDSSLTLNSRRADKEGEALLQVRLTGSRTVEGKTALVESKNTFLTLRSSGDGWKLQVPETAIEKYAAALSAPAAPTSAK